MKDLSTIRAIVTDIEGTTSSLSFVKDVLFPYARDNIRDFVMDHQNDNDVDILLNDVRKIVGDASWSVDQVAGQLLKWIDEDSKESALKTLQGLLWADGYARGDFFGHVYQDAVDVLTQWHEVGLPLYVYSSGSVYAQKLLFSHADQGDLTPLFTGYFDTHVGGKKQADSYSVIANEIGVDPQSILFLSDVVEELDAAHETGMQVCYFARNAENDGELSSQNNSYKKVKSFEEIDLQYWV